MVAYFLSFAGYFNFKCVDDLIGLENVEKLVI